VRDATLDGRELRRGEYIGFVGKDIIAASGDRFTAVCETLEGVGLSRYDVCIVICGKAVSEEESERVRAYLVSRYTGKEVYIIKFVMFIVWIMIQPGF
jgi:dihydroxyacetone kinase-like predicted kinase